MSLSNKLSLYLVLTALVIFASLGFIFVRYGGEREERLVSIYASMSIENFADRIDYDLSRIENNIALSSPEALRVLEHPDRILRFVERYVKTDSLIMGGCIAAVPDASPLTGDAMMMEYASRDGQGEWQSKHLGDSAYDYTAMPWYTDAVSTGKPCWSEPYFDKGGGNKLMVTYSYPLCDPEGKVIAVMTADISIGDLTHEITRLKPVDKGYAFIISKEHTFVTYPDRSKVLSEDIETYAKEKGWKMISELGEKNYSRKSDIFRIDENGKDMLLVCHRMELTDWIICSIAPYSSIMSDLDLLTFKAVVLIVAGLLILLFLIRAIVIYSMRPLSRLTATVDSISSGHLETTLPAMKASDEIGRLNNAFSKMQFSLREQMERLVETTRAKEHIESELHIARSIQMGLVPRTFSPFPEWKGLELFAMLRSAKEVGGDLYDFFIHDSLLFFTIGDVSGKGIPASLFMAVTRTLFRMAAEQSDSPGKIISTINDTIVKDNTECMFVTMFVGTLDLRTGHLRFCNAGHNPPVIIDKNGASFLAENENIPVGVISGYEYKEESLRLTSDSTLFLYTDGLTEAENSSKELYGDQRLLDTLSDNPATPPKEKIERLSGSVGNFAEGVDQSDDLTMLSLRLNHGMRILEHRVFHNSMTEIERIPAITLRLAAVLSLDDTIRDRINLVLEEAIVNVISYAYPEGESGEIELSIGHDYLSDELIIQISDCGKPFDPTKKKDADIDADIDERPIGGLGIFLIRNLCDSAEYCYSDGRNILRLTVALRGCIITKVKN